MNENSYQRPPETDPQKLVLQGRQPANTSLYSDQTLALPMQGLQEMPLTVPAAGYNNVPAGSMGSSLPPTSNAYGFPPAGTALPHPMMAAPLPANPRMRAGRKLSALRVIWWFTFVGVVVASVIVVALFLPAVLAQQNQQGSVASVAPTALPTPTPTMVQPTPTPSSITLNDVTFTPGQFFLTTDCQLNNGYHCALSLQASSALQTSASWSVTAQTQPKTSIQFNLRRGILRRGQQVQLIFVVKGTCPYQGSLLFTVKKGHLTVPLSC